MNDDSRQPTPPAQRDLLADALVALRRARLRAEEIAIATGTAIIEVRDGEIVRVYPTARTGTRAADSES